MAPVVHAGDRLLADVAALREAHRALHDPGLAGQVLLAHVDAVARPAALDAHDLGRLGADRLGARVQRARSARRRAASRRDQQVDAQVGGDHADRASRAASPCVLTECSAAGCGRLRGAAATALARAGRSATASRARPCGRRSRPGGRSCTSAARAAPSRARRPRVSSQQLLAAARRIRMSARMRPLGFSSAA